jgi:hypothetical protein
MRAYVCVCARGRRRKGTVVSGRSNIFEYQYSRTNNDAHHTNSIGVYCGTTLLTNVVQHATTLYSSSSHSPRGGKFGRRVMVPKNYIRQSDGSHLTTVVGSDDRGEAVLERA